MAESATTAGIRGGDADSGGTGDQGRRHGDPISESQVEDPASPPRGSINEELTVRRVVCEQAALINTKGYYLPTYIRYILEVWM